jgi:hypothetical protein
LQKPNSLARCSSQTALPIAEAKQPSPLQQPNSLAHCRCQTALPVAAAKQPCPLQKPAARFCTSPLQQPNSLSPDINLTIQKKYIIKSMIFDLFLIT